MLLYSDHSVIRRVPAIFEQTTSKEIVMKSMFTGKEITV